MKLSFTATQRGLTPKQLHEVERELKNERPSAVIHGGCVGGDDQIDELAVRWGFLRVIFPSNHPTKALPREHFERRGGELIWHDPQPPLQRNSKIVDAGDKLVACPAQMRQVLRSGTWATCRYAKKRKKPVLVIWPR